MKRKVFRDKVNVHHTSTMKKNKNVKRYENLLHFTVIPLIVLGAGLSNYFLLALSFILAIPLNYLLYREYKREDKEKVFLMNKLKALGVGTVFFLIILANIKFEVF